MMINTAPDRSLRSAQGAPLTTAAAAENAPARGPTAPVARPIEVGQQRDARIEPGAAYPQLAEAMVDAVSAQLAVTHLGQPPATDARGQREHLAEVCRESYEKLVSIYRNWQAFLENLIAAHVAYERIDEADVPRTWSTSSTVAAPHHVGPIAANARTAAQELTKKIVSKDLRMPPLALIAPPWFTHELVEAKQVAELYQEAPRAFGQMAATAVAAFLESVRSGQQCGVFGMLHRGRHSVKFTYYTHKITDRLLRESITDNDFEGFSVATSKGARTSSRVLHSHDLLHPEFYDYEATLKNPNLVLPPVYRRLLEDVPGELRPYLTSVFGTQVTEFMCARDDDTQQICEQRIIAHHNPWEPCVVFAGHTVLFGWGKQLMDQTSDLYAEHRAILDRQRKQLDGAARAQGSFWTTIRFGTCLLGLLVGEAVIAAKVGSLAGALFLVPIFVFSAAVFYFAIGYTRRAWKQGSLQARRVTEEGFEELTKKYPPFDPEHPRVVRPDDAQQQSS